MIIMWDGTVYSAKLHMVICQTNAGAEHPIYLNGHLVGRTPPEGTTGCECNLFPIDPNHQRTFEIDPSIVLQGANYITVTNSADPYEEWKGSRAQIELVGHITGTTRSEFQLGTDWEDQRLKAAMQLPMEYDSGGATPLLISLPGTGEDRIDGLNRFAIEANEMGWLLASLDMRHIRWSAVYEQVARSPSLAVQRDVLELLEHMRLHFGVDLSKVYVAGFSTGGGSAATVAAKYPDLLAGALDYSGPADYGQWYAERPDLLTKLEFEFGGGPVANFEYPRRSSRWLSRNLQYVPMRIRHSAVGDTDVPFVQSQNLLLSMSSYFDPSLHHKELITHTQGHVDPDSTAKLNDLQFLEFYVSVGNPQELHILTDEGKDYYWLGVSKAETADNDWQGWVAVDVRYDAAADAIWLAAGDGDFAEGKPLTVTLDLNRMGLAATGPFDAEEYDRNTGEFALHTILPEEGILTLSVPRNAQGVVGREYAIYPSIGAGLGYADLRQGRDGYAGTSDTHIVSDQFPSEGPETPHAQELALQLGCDWRRKALVRFDLSPIPQGVVIKGARLTLALLESRSVGIDVDVYEALTSWEPGFATWTLSDEGKPWSAAGAEGVDSDRAADAYHILHDVRSPGLYSLNAKHLVEKWLATPESNRGLVLIGGGSCSSSTRYPLGSAENGDEGLRPQLEVWYMAPMPALTPTPTATTSPTACTLQGSVSLQGRPAPPHESWSIALLVTIGGTTHNVNSSQMGMFTLPDLTAGTFDIGVKNDHTLRKLKTGVTLVAGETRTVDFGKLLEGDANGDNRVNISDFSILAGGFSPAYDARADFNEDGVVSIADFSLLGSNFNMTGE